MASNASSTDEAHPYGRPAMIAPPAKTSGYVASMTDAMAPPAERPVTNTRVRSTPKFTMARSTISRIDNASPRSRAVSGNTDDPEHLYRLTPSRVIPDRPRAVRGGIVGSAIGLNFPQVVQGNGRPSP